MISDTAPPLKMCMTLTARPRVPGRFAETRLRPCRGNISVSRRIRWRRDHGEVRDGCAALCPAEHGQQDRHRDRHANTCVDPQLAEAAPRLRDRQHRTARLTAQAAVRIRRSAFRALHPDEVRLPADSLIADRRLAAHLYGHDSVTRGTSGQTFFVLCLALRTNRHLDRTSGILLLTCCSEPRRTPPAAVADPPPTLFH